MDVILEKHGPEVGDRAGRGKVAIGIGLNTYQPVEPLIPPAAAHGSPMDAHGPRTQLYSEAFAADPHRVYRELRNRYDSLAPVELAPGIPATLVLDYYTAVRLLNDPDHFPADPRIGQQSAPGDRELPPMTGYRSDTPRTAGSEHAEYQSARAAVIRQIDLYEMHSTVERIATPLVNTFCADGRADLISQYALPLSFGVINSVLGCPPDVGEQAAAGIAAMFDGAGAADGDAIVVETFLELIRRKRVHPGDDVTTRLINGSVELTDEELAHQVALFYRTGMQPTQDVLIDTLRLMLTDDRFAAGLLGGRLTPRDALDEALSADLTISTYYVRYPRRPILIDGVWLPAHQPVVIGTAGSIDDRAVNGGDFTENRSHLAWGGPHLSPARDIAYVIAQEAIDQLLNALPDMRSAVPPSELRWRPGPFRRALSALPVIFPRTPRLNV